MDLVSDCSRCFGLCCVALGFQRSPAFAFDKAPGEPCRHLEAGFGCGVHDRLRSSGLSGCSAFECQGAGQQVSSVTYAGVDWRSAPGTAAEMYAVFGVMRQLHEMLALVVEGCALVADQPRTGHTEDTVAGGLTDLRQRLETLRRASPRELLDADLDRLRARVGDVLRQLSAALRVPAGERLAGADLVGADLRGRDLRRADLRGALLVAADLRGVELARGDLLGADLRDADLAGADLGSALFLAQPQVNAARGSAATRLPAHLSRPAYWG